MPEKTLRRGCAIQRTILAFGETLWDLFPTGAVLGGAPFNFACRANSLGDRGIIISRLGRDKLGIRALETISELSMDPSFIQWDDKHPTGTVEVSLDDSHNPDYHIVPDVAYDFIEPYDELFRLAPQVQCLCFGTLIQRSETSRRTLARLLAAAPGSVKVLDINLRKDCYSDETVRLSLQEADILKLNDDEMRLLQEMLGMSSSDAPAFSREIMSSWSLSHCMVTFGSRGAFVASNEREAVYSPGYMVDVVDSCGSGDAFTAGFVHKLLAGAPLAECTDFANVMGALVATREGATARICLSDISAFMEAGRERLFEEELRAYAAI